MRNEGHSPSERASAWVVFYLQSISNLYDYFLWNFELALLSVFCGRFWSFCRKMIKNWKYQKNWETIYSDGEVSALSSLLCVTLVWWLKLFLGFLHTVFVIINFIVFPLSFRHILWILAQVKLCDFSKLTMPRYYFGTPFPNPIIGSFNWIL